MQRLVIKNFGPLKNIDIKLKSINIIIGENGSGKSILGKLITIFKNDDNLNDEILIDKFKEYNLFDYLKEDSKIIFYKNEAFFITVSKDKVDIPLWFNEVNRTIGKDRKELIERIKSGKYHKKDENIIKMCEESLDNLDYEVTPRYIPAERNIVSLFSDYIATLFSARLPIPMYLIEFMSEFEKARGELKELEFLNYKYKFENGTNKVFYDKNNKEFLSLSHSSSGLQAIFPLLLVIEYFYKKQTLSFIIEEPELNLFPSTQYELIKYIILRINKHGDSPKMLTILTHSPYILSSFNNLLFAYKTASINKNSRKLVNELIEEVYWINPKNFTANYLEYGINKNILSKRDLISENEIDGVSEDIAGEFDEILEIYRESRNGN